MADVDGEEQDYFFCPDFWLVVLDDVCGGFWLLEEDVTLHMWNGWVPLHLEHLCGYLQLERLQKLVLLLYS